MIHELRDFAIFLDFVISINNEKNNGQLRAILDVVSFLTP